MPAEYDRLARQYRRSKDLPFRVASEIPNHLESLGDIAGRAVVDLACGEGFYTRLIRRAGARRVIGVDASAGMIDLARRQEAAHPLGIEYLEIDARRMPELEPFDVVSAAYLFNTAPDRRSLGGMADSAARLLKPGGRLVATLGDLSSHPQIDYSAYGMATAIGGPLPEGAPYEITFLLAEDSFTITDFAWSRDSYEEALSAAGFGSFQWYRPTITSEGMDLWGGPFWETYLAHPPVLRLVAVHNV